MCRPEGASEKNGKIAKLTRWDKADEQQSGDNEPNEHHNKRRGTHAHKPNGERCTSRSDSRYIGRDDALVGGEKLALEPRRAFGDDYSDTCTSWIAIHALANMSSDIDDGGRLPKSSELEKFWRTFSVLTSELFSLNFGQREIAFECQTRQSLVALESMRSLNLKSWN